MESVKNLVLQLCCILSAIVPLQCQLIMRWNGTDISGAAELIYHDEILISTVTISDPNGPGRLVCESLDGLTVNWEFVDGSSLSTSTRNSFYQQRQSENPAISISRLSRSNDISSSQEIHNGIWRCSAGNQNLDVGIYERGRGVLTNTFANVLTPGPFSRNTFTLRGGSIGGPPTTYFWTRNGERISIADDGPYSSTLPFINGDAFAIRQAADFDRNLTVTAHLPGEYVYHASNRATGSSVASFITARVQGESVTDLMAVQIGFDSVRLSWTPPTVPPGNGYRLSTNSTPGSTTAAESPHTLTISQPGIHAIFVVSLSEHLSGGSEVISDFVMRGALPPEITVSSINATSVNVSWAQPLFSFPPVSYSVTLARVTGSGQVCPDVEATISQDTTSTSTVLSVQEFSNYTATVVARFIEFGESFMASSRLNFTTLRAAPTGPPRNLANINTTGSVNVSWNPIRCIDRNGEITGYEVELRLDGTLVTSRVVEGQTFTESGLQPSLYTFRVAGVNSVGRGPFTNVIYISTEGRPGLVSNLRAEVQFTSVVITWDPPQNLNGVITKYEVAYRVNASASQRQNTTETRLVLELIPGTRVTDIAVRSCTSAGLGDLAAADGVLLPAIPVPPTTKNFRVRQILDSDNSVLLTWEKITVKNITGYTVIYSPVSGGEGGEMLLSFSSTENSTIISDLMDGVEYQFQIETVGEFQGVQFTGSRTEAAQVSASPPESEPLCEDCLVNIIISVVATFILTLLLATIIASLVGCICCHSRHRKSNVTVSSKKKNRYTEPDVAAIPMRSNAAYGPVSSSELDKVPEDYIYAEPNAAMDTYEEMGPGLAVEDTYYT